MEEIARRAGLGSTTLHRHFPIRQALLDAVFHDRVDALCARAQDLLGHPDPDAALVTWLRAFVTHAATQRGLPAALASPAASDPPPDATCCTMIRSAGGELLARAQQAGSARPGIAITDLLTLARAIALITEQEPDGPTQADQMLAIAIDGIKKPDPHAP